MSSRFYQQLTKHQKEQKLLIFKIKSSEKPRSEHLQRQWSYFGVTVGRPKLRVQDGVEASVIKAGITDWQTKTRDRERFRTLLMQAKKMAPVWFQRNYNEPRNWQIKITYSA